MNKFFVSKKAICPHCEDSEYLQFIVTVKLHLYQGRLGGLFVDKTTTNEMNDDNPIEINGMQGSSGIHAIIVEGKEKEVIVICLSEKCEGREMTYSELLRPEDMKIANKPF